MSAFIQAQNVLVDKTSGSSELLENFIACLTSDLKANDFKNLHHSLKNILTDLISAFPDMQVINHFVNDFNTRITTDDSKEQIIQFLEHYQSSWNEYPAAIAKNLISKIEIKSFSVLLHSNSATVINVLKILKNSGYIMKAYQTRSSPENEGEIQAKALIENGIDVTVIPDSEFISLDEQLDYCFLGADSIFSDYWVNKTGSGSIARFCNSHKIPVYILADPRKVVNKSLGQDPIITNQYLEAIPLEMGKVILPD